MADRDHRGGIREGVAKCVSQACVYGLEAKKTFLQVNGCLPTNMPPCLVWQRMITGVLTSSITSGVVFGTYFTVYNHMNGHMLAGATAALATSVIKVPISNGMRVMQSGRARNLVHATRKIVKAHNVAGLYSGYRVSLLEDVVEFDLRARLYQGMRTMDPLPGISTAIKGFLGGAVSGAITAGITTPFDCVKAHIAQDAAKVSGNVSAIRAANRIWCEHGIPGFFRGVEYRVASNMVKSALFFTVFELLP